MSVFTEIVYDTERKREVFVKHFCKKKIIKIARFYTIFHTHVDGIYCERAHTSSFMYLWWKFPRKELQFEFICILLFTFDIFFVKKEFNVGLFLTLRNFFHIIFHMKNSNYHMILIMCVKPYRNQEPIFDLLVLNITSSKL